METDTKSASQPQHEMRKHSDFREMLEHARKSGKYSGLSALILDATNTEHWDVFRHFQSTALHLGAVSVASLLAEAGFGDVKAVYEVLTPKFDYSQLNPDIIGVSAIIANTPFANRKIRMLRKEKPDALILAGGAGYFFNPDMALDAGADAVVIGKAEYPVLQLLEKIVDREPEESIRSAFMKNCLTGIKGLYTGEGEPVPADMVMKMDDVPDADFGLIAGKTSKRLRTIISSEGCTVRDCEFCTAKLLNNNRYRHNGAEAVARKMKKAQEDGVKHVFIADDHFLGRGYSNFFEIAKTIRNAGLNVKWSAQLTMKSIYDRLNEGIVDLLARSNCSGVYFGVESIYDDELEQMNASKKTSYEMTKAVFEAFRDRISIHAMCVLKPFVKEGNPTNLDYAVEDTPKSRKTYRQRVMDMVDFLKQYGVRTAQFHSAVPLPGAKMSSRFFDAGIVLKKVGGMPVDWSKYTGQHVVASANPVESHNIMIDAYKRFYSLGGMVSSALKQKFRQAFLRSLGKFIVFEHLNSPETRRYVKAIKSGDFEFYNPGEKPYNLCLQA